MPNGGDPTEPFSTAESRAALLAQVELQSAANLRVGNRLRFVRWLVEHGKLHEWPCVDCAGLGSYGTGAICVSCDGTGRTGKTTEA